MSTSSRYTQSESVVLCGNVPEHQPQRAQNTCASLTVQTDLSLSLPQVLALAECPTSGMVEGLAETSRHREEFLALLRLWQSLGRPASGFWSETRVFVNRCLNS